MLVQAVVGEVHVGIGDVLRVADVLLRGESHQPLVEHVHPQRVERRDEDVDAEVELVSIDEEGVGDVLLHHPRRGWQGVLAVIPLGLGAEAGGTRWDAKFKSTPSPRTQQTKLTGAQYKKILFQKQKIQIKTIVTHSSFASCFQGVEGHTKASLYTHCF